MIWDDSRCGYRVQFLPRLPLRESTTTTPTRGWATHGSLGRASAARHQSSGGSPCYFRPLSLSFCTPITHTVLNNNQ